MDVPLPRFTWVEVSGIRLYSYYLPPSDSIEEFERFLDTIVASAKTSTLPIVIGGDFNAWATEWGSKKTNHRGRTVLEDFAILKLEIANIGVSPTYIKGEKSSIVDLTFVDPRLSREDSYWQVSDPYTGSDHRALTYQLHLTSSTANITRMPKREKWAPATFDRETFLCFLEGTSVEGTTAETRAQSLSRTITAACNASMSTSRIIADDIQSTGGTRTLRYYVKNAFVLGGYIKEQFVDPFMQN